MPKYTQEQLKTEKPTEKQIPRLSDEQHEKMSERREKYRLANGEIEDWEKKLNEKRRLERRADYPIFPRDITPGSLYWDAREKDPRYVACVMAYNSQHFAP